MMGKEKQCRPGMLALLALLVATIIGMDTPALGETTSAPRDADGDTAKPRILVSEPVVPARTPAVRDLPPRAPLPVRHGEINPRLTRGRTAPPRFQGTDGIDPLLSLEAFAAPRVIDSGFGTLILNLAGQGFTGVYPPDTVGDVGPDHYVQIVNGSDGTPVRIYNKVTGAQIGQFTLDSLASGGSPCSIGFGDPIVLYDGLADRWLLAEFAYPGAGNHICVYVSETPDPTGAYFFYDFPTPDFPDYFKIGVWPDAYYVGANESTYTVYALDRAGMLAGAAATSIRFSGQTNFLLPADVDGATPPPAGTPGYFYTFKDNNFHGGSDRIEVFAFDADFTTPANSTFTLLAGIPITSFTYTVCGFFKMNCIPQPGTSQKVDPVSEWPMWRFSYRNFGDRETLLGNFTVDTGGDHAGVRWFELRNTGGGWSLYQEGTHSPDSVHRWMGSIAMDGSGNIALGYNVSDAASVYPGLRYAGRLADDPSGTLPQGEYTLRDGATASNFINRYGDYSAMSVDPADDCTFWFTGEYNSGSNWSTRIGSFKFDNCGAPEPPATITVTYPNGGEILRKGTSETIRWTYTGNAGASVKIKLHRNGAPVYVIKKNTPIGSGGNGSFN